MSDRNLDERYITKEVIMARLVWGREYARQNGGQVDFYDSLSESSKRIVKELVDGIEKCTRRQL